MRCVLDGVENGWKRRCRVTLNSQILSFSTWTLGWYTNVEQRWASLSERIGDLMRVFPLRRRGSSYTGEWCRGPGEGQNASYARRTDPRWVDGGLLRNSVLGQRFPTFDLGRDVGAWEAQQTWRPLFGFGKLEIFPVPCVQQNQKCVWLEMLLLIFKPLCIFYVNLIHMVLIYFYLTHQVKLGATMMNGNNADFQEDFWAFFLRTKSHSTPPHTHTPLPWDC